MGHIRSWVMGHIVMGYVGYTAHEPEQCTCPSGCLWQLEQEHSTVFQLHTLNRTLQHRVQALGEEVSLGETTSFPLSLQSEIQQSQVLWLPQLKLSLTTTQITCGLTGVE